MIIKAHTALTVISIRATRSVGMAMAAVRSNSRSQVHHA